MNFLRLNQKSSHVLALIISGFQVSLMAVLFSLSNDLGFYFIIFIPVSVGLLFILCIIDIKLTGTQFLQYFFVIDLILATVTIPIFLGVYYGILHPVHSLSYEKIENCQVIGIAPIAQPSYEVYTIMYVNFEYDNQQFLGYACSSDQVSNPVNYFPIEMGDDIACDDVGNSYDTPYNQRLRQLYSIDLGEEHSKTKNSSSKSQFRFLRKRGSCLTGTKGKSYAKYNFSDYKLASWMCMWRNQETFEELTKERTCYVHFRSTRERSYKNAQERLNLREVYYFAIVEFDLPVYYPKSGTICLFIFTYLPFNLLFYPIYKILFDMLLKYFKRNYNKLQESKLQKFFMKLYSD